MCSTQNRSREDIMNKIKEDIDSFTNIKQINDYLLNMVAVDAYVVINEIIKPKTNLVIQSAKKNDVESYQYFQNIMLQSKKAYDVANSPARMVDINDVADKIASRYYSICVRMISVIDDELGKIEQAVNTIEERLGIALTDFNEKENDDCDSKGNDEQSIKGVINQD